MQTLFDLVVDRLPQLIELGLIAAVAAAAVLWAASIAWMLRDARRTPVGRTAATGIALTLSAAGPFGLPIYLAIRPIQRDRIDSGYLEGFALALSNRAYCRCGAGLQRGFLFCPACAHPVRTTCRACERPLDFTWKQCPYCLTQGVRPRRAAQVPAAAPVPALAPQRQPAAPTARPASTPAHSAAAAASAPGTQTAPAPSAAPAASAFPVASGAQSFVPSMAAASRASLGSDRGARRGDTLDPLTSSAALIGQESSIRD